MAVSVNGKLRDVIEVGVDEDEESIKGKALSSEKLKAFLGDTPIRKVIVVKGKIVNVVI